MDNDQMNNIDFTSGKNDINRVALCTLGERVTQEELRVK